MSLNHYDVIIIGTGAGGGTLAYALAGWGKKVLLLERGGRLPQEQKNWEAHHVFGNRCYRTDEQWLDRNDVPFNPGMHYYVGGNTKMFGAALVRFRREDFRELQLQEGISPAWPIAYEDLAPYYTQAEDLYRVHGQAADDPTDPRGNQPFPKPPIPHTTEIAQLAGSLKAQGLHPYHIPLGIDWDPPHGKCGMGPTCDGFPCKVGAKSDAETCAVNPALRDSNITLMCNAKVERLVTTNSGQEIQCVKARIEGVEQEFRGSLIVLACGAVNSAALLLRSHCDTHPNGLANSSDLVGRNYMAHLNTAVSAIDPFRRHDTGFQKTLAFNDYYLKGPRGYPLGNVQLIGKLQRGMLVFDKKGMPDSVLNWLARHSIDWWVLSEDLPLHENRVEWTKDSQIRVKVRWTNRLAHEELIELLCRALRRAGYWVAGRRLPFTRVWDAEKIESCSHQVGTLRFGHDPKTSVLDVFCKSHDVKNLFVVDGSFFPSSGGVNPALTIMAQALRVGAWMRETY